jgi:hypothetical protein
VAAVDVDVVHPRLVADRVEDERQMYEGVDLVPLEELLNLPALADVGLDELRLRPGTSRRAEVDVDDLLGLLATGELVREPSADVPGAPCDQVAHELHPILAVQPASANDPSSSPAPGNPARSRGKSA